MLALLRLASPLALASCDSFRDDNTRKAAPGAEHGGINGEEKDFITCWLQSSVLSWPKLSSTALLLSEVEAEITSLCASQKQSRAEALLRAVKSGFFFLKH